MKLFAIDYRTPNLVKQLIHLWEKTVKASHNFLSDDEIQQIKKYVPEALNNILIPLLVLWELLKINWKCYL